MELTPPERITNTHVFFWNSPYSQWFTSPNLITDYAGQTYSSAEKYMMVKKAELFNANDIKTKMLATDSPRTVKALGRQITNFDNDLWDEHKLAIVTEGNYLKFSQNPELLAFMKSHADKQLVEASPVDKIWGIGLHPTDPLAEDEANWQGENLLGIAIMSAREQVLSSC